MKLKEIQLSGFKELAKKRFKHIRNIFDIVNNNGYTLSGEGTFSQVYIKNGSNIAIKISTRNDQCWLTYAQFVKSHPHKHYLKIGSVNKHDEFFIAWIERLIPIKGEILGIIEDWRHVYFESDGFDSEEIQNDPSFNKSNVLKFDKENPELRKAVNLINQKLVNSGCELDIGSQNFMQRKDGTIVIIDPIYYAPEFE